MVAAEEGEVSSLGISVKTKTHLFGLCFRFGIFCLGFTKQKRCDEDFCAGGEGFRVSLLAFLGESYQRVSQSCEIFETHGLRSFSYQATRGCGLGPSRLRDFPDFFRNKGNTPKWLWVKTGVPR